MANDIVLGYPNITPPVVTHLSTTTVNLSSTTNTAESGSDEHSKLTIGILATLYTLIFIIGITGNSLVVYVVCMKKSMQTVTNLFIMNLALSDILMCLLAVPFTPISFFQEDWQLGKFLCHLESWPIPMSKRFFNLASLVLQYLIPFVVITYSYTKVWIMLSNRNRPGSNMGAKRINEEIDVRRKKRTNRMLVAMVIIFAGCWMPLNCVHLTMEFNTDFTKKPYFSNVFFIAHVIAMSSTIYNPFLYAWLNVNFRKEFRLILPWLFKLLKWCARENPNDQANKTVEENYEEAGEENGMLDETMGGGGGGGATVGDNFHMNRLESKKCNNNGVARSDSIRGRENGLRGSRKGGASPIANNKNRSGSLKDNNSKQSATKQQLGQSNSNSSSTKQLSKKSDDASAPLNPTANSTSPNQVVA